MLQVRLREKSIEAYILALETINRLSIVYRVEAFAYLICNAWELLLKSRMLSQSQPIFYPSKPGEKARSLALRDCLERTFTNERDPVRVNVEKIADLRDEGCHLVISRVPRELLSLFQAAVLNYHRHLNTWWGLSLSDRVSVGMMTIVYDLGPEEFDLGNSRLRKEMDRTTAEYLLKFQAELRSEAEALGLAPEFSLDLTYHLALVKKLKDGDVTLEVGPDGKPTQLLEVPRDPGITHPFRLSNVLQKVNALIGSNPINTYDLQCVARAYGIEKRPEFFHLTSVKGSQKQYSQAYIDWLAREVEKKPTFFSNARISIKKSVSPRPSVKQPQLDLTADRSPLPAVL